MRAYDFSPLYRSSIGFDRLAALLDQTRRADAQVSYPPYNIELTGDDKYLITMAVAGLSRSELDLETGRGQLKVVGRKSKDEAKHTLLHRGIATRDFEHRFQLADHVHVTGSRLDNGLLHIDLVREVPEAMKPRKIEISSHEAEQVLEAAA
jgi:molecular chaperone IbpA